MENWLKFHFKKKKFKKKKESRDKLWDKIWPKKKLDENPQIPYCPLLEFGHQSLCDDWKFGDQNQFAGNWNCGDGKNLWQ
jgi:hypothetical protein